MTHIIEFQYFPPSTLFKGLGNATHLLFEQYENFQKVSFRNRMFIAGAAGPILLTIPLRGGRNQKRLMKEIVIDNRTAWRSTHCKTIVSCYNRSPWFEFYRDELEEIYKTSFEFLAAWNLACFKWSLKKLELNVTVSLTDRWEEKYDPREYTDWRNRFTPASIQTRFPDAPMYRQVFSERTGFIPHLSILDLLFCEGRNARTALSRQ